MLNLCIQKFCQWSEQSKRTNSSKAWLKIWLFFDVEHSIFEFFNFFSFFLNNVAPYNIYTLRSNSVVLVILIREGRRKGWRVRMQGASLFRPDFEWVCVSNWWIVCVFLIYVLLKLTLKLMTYLGKRQFIFVIELRGPLVPLTPCLALLCLSICWSSLPSNSSGWQHIMLHYIILFRSPKKNVPPRVVVPQSFS